MEINSKALSPNERSEALEIERYLEREICVRSFSEFVKLAWQVIEPRTPYVHGWHIDAISEHLEALLVGEIKNLIINIPPRHMKSSLITVLFPAWVWIKKPEEQWLFASYSASLSKRDSIKCRRIIESQWYRSFFNIEWKLASDQNEKMRFNNSREGYRIATSVGGTGTGEGGGWIVVDDPHKADEIHSKTKRDSVINWWDQTMSSRGNDPKTFRKIIVMQRLHREDLSGHALDMGGYEHLVLPAEYEGNKNTTGIGWEDPRNKEGELLWPERFGHTELLELKKSMGSIAAAGQLQQRPSQVQGNLVHRDWIRFWKEKPARFDELWISWDLTNKGSDDGDYSVGQVWGRVSAQYYLIDQVRRKMNFTEEISAFKSLCGKWPGLTGKLVEEKANGFALLQLLKKEVPGLVPYNPKTSKVERLAAVSPLYEAGNVLYPDPSIASWVHDNIEELVGFPNEKHDDTVDCSTQMLIRFTSGASVGKFGIKYNDRPQSISREISRKDTW